MSNVNEAGYPCGMVLSDSSVPAVYHCVNRQFPAERTRTGLRAEFSEKVSSAALNLWYNTVMSEKRINNSIFIMFLLSGAYCAAHNISTQEFLALDDKYAILNYIAECPDVFDSMTEDEMVKEIDDYVKGV